MALPAISWGSSQNTSKFKNADNPISGQYIVVLKNSSTSAATSSTAAAVSAKASSLASQYGGTVSHTYSHSLRGFAMKASAAAAQAMAEESDVAFVEEDGIIKGDTDQSSATWGLDRIDQRDLPRDSTYSYDYTGSGVHAYVLDSGILTTHSDFGGRASLDYTTVNDGYGASDCHGHGTHVAGIIGSSTWGVAKNVALHSVRVLGCENTGTISNAIAGVEWVTKNHKSPAVANMSLTVTDGTSQALDNAVNNSIASGVTYVVVAGNGDSNNVAQAACNYSPARVPAAITVGATNNKDARASFSNYGTCVDIFAPGVSIVSTSKSGGHTTMSGTSMAAPHVAGVAALYLESNPSASPTTVENVILRAATMNHVTDASSSPNHLLYARLPLATRAALFRYYNTSSYDHFYTTNWSEVRGGGSGSWTYEGVTGWVSLANASGTTPLYRYYNTSNGNRFFTTNWSEVGSGSGSWTYEGVAGYMPTSAASDTTNFYRYYNGSTYDHLLTSSWSELGSGSGNWTYEGVQSLIYTKP